MNKLKTYWLFASILFANNLLAQYRVPHLITNLPIEINEASGIEINNFGSIWINNDSGDDAVIYKTDTLGNLLRTFSLEGINAIDMEELAKDDSDNFYLGDFGNNLSNRNNLKIYKFSNPDNISIDSVMPQVISFSYNDQTEYSPNPFGNFDCEAMFCRKDSLWIFSKNHGISGYTKLYKLPTTSGNYIINPLDSFYSYEWITAADISPDGNTVVLLSDSVLWILGNYKGGTIFNGNKHKITLPSSQKEGIVFINNNEVLIVDENEWNTTNGQKLYRLNIDEFTTNLTNNLNVASEFKITLVKNNSNIELLINSSLNEKISIKVLDDVGRTLYSSNNSVTKGINKMSLELSNNPNGVYIVMLMSDKCNEVVKVVLD